MRTYLMCFATLLVVGCSSGSGGNNDDDDTDQDDTNDSDCLTGDMQAFVERVWAKTFVVDGALDVDGNGHHT